jgi:hypothetical protein
MQHFRFIDVGVFWIAIIRNEYSLACLPMKNSNICTTIRSVPDWFKRVTVHRPPGTGSFFGTFRCGLPAHMKAEKSACPLAAEAPPRKLGQSPVNGYSKGDGLKMEFPPLARLANIGRSSNFMDNRVAQLLESV